LFVEGADVSSLSLPQPAKEPSMASTKAERVKIRLLLV